MSLGKDGFTRLAKDLMEVAATMKDGINGIEGLKVLGYD